MCNLYSLTTTQEAMRRLFDVKQDRLGNLGGQPALFPDGEIPVVRESKEGGRELVKCRWGFPAVRSGRPVTNIRNLESRYWAGWLGKPEFRCLVPATSFAEYHPTEKNGKGHKAVAWFALEADNDEDRPLFAFAGLWRPWSGERKKGEEGEFQLAAFCTKDANDVVKPIHPKAMPVILDPADYEQWLTGSKEEAMALQRPLPSERLRLARVGGKADGTMEEKR
ncbi:MAG: SOS response-associated peptidase [Devosia sp.]